MTDLMTDLQVSDELLAFIALAMWIVRQVMTWKTNNDTK